jgi:hypothetical protein
VAPVAGEARSSPEPEGRPGGRRFQADVAGGDGSQGPSSLHFPFRASPRRRPAPDLEPRLPATPGSRTARVQFNGWQMYVTTVDAIEAATGYDFLAGLPDDIEALVEATVAS